ncbi:hypothetical protein [Kineococcus glutinatus]|uniref:LGFP repeat-containing protein n=1 Tax=Kineococcus glutinatus TaxID=1070872 RepID=A0ABP9H747_9ACTN
MPSTARRTTTSTSAPGRARPARTATAALLATAALGTTRTAPAPAARADVGEFRAEPNCQTSSPEWTLSFVQDGSVVHVRDANALEARLPEGTGELRYSTYGTPPFSLLDVDGTVLATARASAPAHPCDGWRSRADYAASGSNTPGWLQSAGELPAEPTERTAEGVEVYRGTLGSLYVRPTGNPPTGHVVRGAIRDRYLALGGHRGFLGHPRSSERGAPAFDGFATSFSGGTIAWSPDLGTHLVRGAIRERYEFGDRTDARIGVPAGEEFGPLREGGYGQHFRRGSIYWTPRTGPAVVEGAIRDLWARTGWERGPLGYPLGDEIVTGRYGEGRAQRFQGGTAYWSPSTGAHRVAGAIAARYEAVGGPGGFLGFPTTDEFGPLRGGGAGQHFAYGSVYWSPATDAHAVDTRVALAWGQAGWEAGYLGYPVADTMGRDIAGPGRIQHFQGASLYFGKPDVIPVRGAILAAYRAFGAERSALGWPGGPEQPTADGAVQSFSGGTITWNPVRGTTVAVTQPLRRPTGTTNTTGTTGTTTRGGTR